MDFFIHRGSFTTPKLDIGESNAPLLGNLLPYDIGCQESVIWTVFKEPLKISYRQLKKLWTLRTNTDGNPYMPLNETYRPTQPLKNRDVEYYDLEFDCKNDGDDWHYDRDCHIKYRYDT